MFFKLEKLLPEDKFYLIDYEWGRYCVGRRTVWMCKAGQPILWRYMKIFVMRWADKVTNEETMKERGGLWATITTILYRLMWRLTTVAHTAEDWQRLECLQPITEEPGWSRCTQRLVQNRRRWATVQTVIVRRFMHGKRFSTIRQLSSITVDRRVYLI